MTQPATPLTRQQRQEQVESWMTEYGTRIMRLAYMYLKDRQGAEDVAQEVFWRAYQHLDSFRGDSQVSTWLCRIAVNLCRDRLRAAGSRRITLPDAMPVITGDTAEPEAEVLQADIRQTVFRELMVLPDPYREVLVLHYYSDLPIAEIARATGDPEGTIKTHLHRGRRLLQQRLAQQEQSAGSRAGKGAES